jgi:mannose-6-phosphate isomerase-like protein (cupin superfamily)
LCKETGGIGDVLRNKDAGCHTMTKAVYDRKMFDPAKIDAIRSTIERDGWDPTLIVEPPGAVYPPHQHETDKLLVFLEGDMAVRAGGDWFTCQAGDRLIIPGQLEHEAVAGAGGCRYFWSEQLRGVG